ncbi:MAG: hypothetical protein Q9N02_00070 [Ghiorsea sp.]|nr:hypothetical protein [Ghiorsea sp.]
MKQRILFLMCLLSLLGVRTSYSFHDTWDKPSLSSSVFSPKLLQVMAGHLPGLVANFQILDAFSIFSAMSKNPSINYGTYLEEDLDKAIVLDPNFQDTYRLASSILAFDAHMPQAAVDLLERGTYAAPERWEPPFLGGFIASQQLSDNQKAFELMNIAKGREGAPSYTGLLAAHYLKNNASREEMVYYLQALLQIIPEAYAEGIRKKIKSLQENHD